MIEGLGRMLVLIGGGLLLVGLLLMIAGRIPGVGRLPGDILIERESFSLYAPVGTMIVLSIVLTVVINLVGRFFR